MFPYATVSVFGMTIKQSVPTKDMVDSVTYQTPTGPLTQPEFHVYINGEIELTNGSFTQVMTECQSSFDVNLPQYNIQEPVEEKVLSTAAARFSIYSSEQVEKTQLTLTPNQTYTFVKNSILFLMAGVAATDTFSISGFAFRPIEAGTTLTAQTESRIIVCNLAG